MTGAKSFALQATAWERDPVEYTAESRLILDLYDREQIALRRYLVYLGLDSDSAAETVQESFLRLHQHLIAGGDRSNLRAWIYRVAHNLARNTQTAIRTTRTGSLTDAGHAEIVADSSASAEQQLLTREAENQVENALRQLSAAQKNCLVLRAQGLKYREIATALNLSVSTVAENVQRGLEKLKESI